MVTVGDLSCAALGRNHNNLLKLIFRNQASVTEDHIMITHVHKEGKNKMDNMNINFNMIYQVFAKDCIADSDLDAKELTVYTTQHIGVGWMYRSWTKDQLTKVGEAQTIYLKRCVIRVTCQCDDTGNLT